MKIPSAWLEAAGWAWSESWSAMLLVTATLLVLVSAGNAEENNKVVRVCIATHSSNDALLLQLGNTLHNHKPAKTSHVRVEGLQVGGLSEVMEKENLSEEARDKARKNRCDYVLVVNNPDVKSSLSAQPNVMHPERQETTSTYDPYMRRQDHDFYVTINYRLYPIDSATTSAEGFVSTHDAAPERAVVSAALDMLANQVFTKVTK
jgi:hypothetical protein